MPPTTPLIGRVVATELKPSTPHQFYFWTRKDAAVGIGAIVRVEHGERTVYAVVTDGFAYADLLTRWREIAGLLSHRFPESDLGDIAPEELSALPGIQEVLGLHEVGELAVSGRWDHVVVDCASTADALRMLTQPGVGHLLVSPRTATSPQGVVSEIDLVRLASGG